MTCKDCYHYEMCLPRVAVSNDKICRYFKDKSRLTLKVMTRLEQKTANTY